MSAIDEVIETLQSVLAELGDATGAAATARAKTEEAIETANALGASYAATQLTTAKDSIETLTERIDASLEVTNTAISHAKAAVDGT